MLKGAAIGGAGIAAAGFLSSESIAAAQDSTPQAQTAGGTLNLVDATEPNSLEPSVGTGPFSHVILGMFEGLVQFDANMAAQPLLALKWAVGSDQLTWTFNLKPNVTFHDGTPFNADAVKFSLERIQGEDFGATRRSNFLVIKTVTPVDDLTVEIVTTKPFPDLPFLLADQSAAVVSPTAVQKLGDDQFGLNPVGTGAFSFVEWVPNDHVTIKKYDGYHGTPAYLDQVIFHVVPEAATRQAQLESGEADLIISPPTASVKDLQGESQFTTLVYNSLTQVTSEMRQTKPPFSVKEVRQAMNYALDKQAIIDTIMSGLGTVADSPAPPGIWGAKTYTPYAYDPDKAKQLLAAGGYADGFDGDLFYVSGRWAGDDEVTQAMVAYWSQIGVNITIHQVDSATLDEWLSDDPDNRAGWTTQQIRSSSYLDYHLYRLFDSGSTLAVGAQRSGYHNPQVDQLIEQGETTFDQDARLKAYSQAQDIIWDDAPICWIFTQANVLVYKAGMKGVNPHPNTDLLLREISLS